jgi:hypothetical protein
MDPSPSAVISQELLSWKGVTIHEHNFVSMIFYVNGIEMGHLHGDSIADLQFPAKVSKKLVKEGYVSPHHIIPKSGWVSHEIQNAKDVKAVIELFRFQYQNNLLGFMHLLRVPPYKPRAFESVNDQIHVICAPESFSFRCIC